MINNFIKKIKLAEDFSLKLNTNKTNFTNELTKLTVPESFFASVFGNKEKLFIGSISSHKISIRPKGRQKKSNYSYAAQLNANYSGNSKEVLVEGAIQISKKYFVMMLVPTLFYFAVVIPLFVIQSHSVPMLIATSIQFIIMIGVFYFILRKAIKISKEYFEKELMAVMKNS